ncbi:Hypothetical predicted protein [Paramuricea clavata]|uniref:Uncharacterized protein n=1 Tax=Paramuricea clavata TaxID=317549 RepID=A0A7D9DQY8_PARCT|nr:Hypothetical predicted protein [Paramuricea clavata]
MDSNVQTKLPNKRRSKYIIVGLIAVICVLCFQLHRENRAKKELIARKSFLIGKLYECRVASEKINTKYKDKRTQNEKLTKDLAAITASNEDMLKKYDELQTSYHTKTDELQQLQQSADERKNELSALKENYENAMSSVTTMQGKLDDTIKVCEQHKENSRSANITTAQRTRELEICKRGKTVLEQEREDLVASEQDLQKKIAEMGQAKSVRSVDENAGGLHVQQPQEQLNVKSPTAGKLKYAEYVHSLSNQNSDRPAQSTQDQTSRTAVPKTPVEELISSQTQTTPPPKTPTKEVIQVAPSLKRPTTKLTLGASLLRAKGTTRKNPPEIDDSLI